MLTLAVAAAIGWFTLRPSEADAESAARLPWTCLVACDDQALRDALLNIVLFVPLGWALARWLRPRHALLLVVLATVSIEFTQYHWLLGRDASLRDILTNALGGGLGILLATRWRRLFLPTPRASRRLGTLALAGWLGLVVSTALLVRPRLPASVYWGQWAPELGQFATWPGRVLGATVAGQRLPSGRLEQSAALRRALLQDSVLVTARVVAGAPPPDLAPIVSVFDSEQREIFLLGQQGRGLVFRLRSGVRAVQLGDLSAWFPAPPPWQAGDTLTVTGGVVRGAWVLGVETPRASAWRRVPYSSGLLWAGLWPWHPLIGPAAAWLSGLWLGAALFPAAYWLARTGAGWIGAAAGAVLALYLVSRLAGLALPTLPEPVGVLAGAGLGALAARFTRRVRPDPVH